MRRWPLENRPLVPTVVLTQVWQQGPHVAELLEVLGCAVLTSDPDALRKPANVAGVPIEVIAV